MLILRVKNVLIELKNVLKACLVVRSTPHKRMSIQTLQLVAYHSQTWQLVDFDKLCDHSKSTVVPNTYLYYQHISTPTFLGWSKDNVVDTLRSEMGGEWAMNYLEIHRWSNINNK